MSPASRLRTVLLVAPFVAAWLALYAPRAAEGAARTLVVEAGPGARANVPMSVDVPAGTAQARMMDGAKEVPCQVADGKLWWILDDLAAGAWNSSAEACRAAYRVAENPGFQDACFALDAIGFRCVRKAPAGGQ